MPGKVTYTKSNTTKRAEAKEKLSKALRIFYGNDF
jgi:hypothetical protein